MAKPGLVAKVALTAVGAAMCLAPMGCKRYSAQSQLPLSGSPSASLAIGSFLDAGTNGIDPASVARMAAGAGYVLVGEGHPVACDHLTQARLIGLMVQAGTPPAVGLEMVSLDFQPVLDRFNRGEIALDDLAAALDWEHTWGYAFAVYRPIFDEARSHGLPVFALNVPRDVARKVGRVGLQGLTAKEREGLPASILPAPKDQEQDLREVFDLHPAGTSSQEQRTEAWQRFLTVQSLWDTVMAERAVAVRQLTERPVVVIAGGGHVGNGWGIASRLAVLDPTAKRLLVMPWRGGEPPEAAQANIFAYCPETMHFRLGFTLEAGEAGVLVTEVDSGSKAAAAGFKSGDRISGAGGHRVVRLFDLHQAALEAIKDGVGLRLHVPRDGAPLELTIVFEPANSGS